MKILCVVLFFASFASATDQTNAAASACGPTDVQFDVSSGKSATPAPQAQKGKAQVYVLGVFERPANQLSRPTNKVGMDGQWIGAIKNNSYLSFSVDPGDHHLCVGWQSHFKAYSKNVALAGFTAAAGKTYYFRDRVIEHGGEAAWFTLDLEPLNSDEAQLRLTSAPLSTSHPKK